MERQFNFSGKIYTISDSKIVDNLSFTHFGCYDVPIIPSYNNVYYVIRDGKLVAFKFKAFFYLSDNARYFVAEGANGLFLIPYRSCGDSFPIWESVAQYMEYQKLGARAGYYNYKVKFETYYMSEFVERTTNLKVGSLSNGERYIKAFKFGNDGNLKVSDIGDKIITVNYFYVDERGTHCDTTINKEGWHRTKQEVIDEACNVEIVGFGEEDSQALKTYDVEVKVTLKVKAKSLKDAKGIVDHIPNDAWHV